MFEGKGGREENDVNGGGQHLKREATERDGGRGRYVRDGVQGRVGDSELASQTGQPAKESGKTGRSALGCNGNLTKVRRDRQT